MAGGLFLLPGDGALPAGGGAMVEVPDQIPLVAITFDDGPRDSTTSRLLDELALREVQATFFLVGNRIEGNEALIQRMADEGHQVAVHSYSHIRLTALSQADFDFEVGQTRTRLAAILGQQDFWLRPPYGITDSSVRQRADCPIVLWSVDPEDWKDRNTGRIVDQVLSKVQDGDIILFHDIYDSSVDAAVQVVDALLEQGYCFCTVEQLLSARGVTPECGKLYTRVVP
jgi:peptidoglycan/xylan/chitin deacetylase (PgdA/CDA1 family)